MIKGDLVKSVDLMEYGNYVHGLGRERQIFPLGKSDSKIKWGNHLNSKYVVLVYPKSLLTMPKTSIISVPRINIVQRVEDVLS